MNVHAPLIDAASKIYIYTPAIQGKELYLCPICLGTYRYLPGYSLRRDYYPGYSLILLDSGECRFSLAGAEVMASAGDIVFMSGYAPHSYDTKAGFGAVWIHFDGIMASRFFKAVTEKQGQVITPSNVFQISKLMREIYGMFDRVEKIKESVISRNLTDILTALLEQETSGAENTDKIYESIRYMNEHLREDITVSELAAQAYLSSYYYIHQFKKTTGFPPHAYLLNLRISHAKYYLKTTERTIREIALLCGFANESSFCNTFRKRTGSSPGSYRRSSAAFDPK